VVYETRHRTSSCSGLAISGLLVMKSQLSLIFILITLLLRNSCGHLRDPCDDKLLNRVPSPNGKLVLSTYHRECSYAVLTTAAVEQPPGFWGSRGEVVCYLVSWSGRHSIDAAWQSADSIFISTIDRLESLSLETQKNRARGLRSTIASSSGTNSRRRMIRS
jgi:hypothetical protein